MTRLILACAAILGCIGFDASVFAQAPDSAGNRFFESKIRPALTEHCYECHSTAAGKARGGLKVDSRDALLRGGDSGPSVVAKSLDDSLLYQAMLYHDDDYQMPPKGKLPNSIIDDFRKWILMGAPDPRVAKIASDVISEIDVEAGRQFWAYQPLSKTSPWKVTESDWARTPIDQFVSKKLKEQWLKPARDAAPAVLVRRLYFVITGLPPTSEDSNKWTNKLQQANNETDRQSVVAQLVDQLLASKRYGERWGRHWLDVARYAESTGGDHNNVYQHAWRYRDYVIDAFNDDKPFDNFVREQIAGDLLPIEKDEEWATNIIATGFLAIGVKSVGEEDQQKFFADLVDEQIDTTTRAFLATTVACARCHDHKFDPIPQSDYYALAGIFRSTETHYGLLKAQARQATTLVDLTGMGPPPGTPQLNGDEYAALVKERDDAAKAIDDAMKKIRSGENVFRGLLRKLRSDRDETEAALQAYSNRGQPRVFAMGTQDRDAALQTRLLVRGELDKPAQFVDRGVLQVLSPAGRNSLNGLVRDASFRSHRTDGLPNVNHYSKSGRLELAEWIASPENPLTARVIVNRVWHWMFGRGLVRTVDDFGHAGEVPTYPELLDYLANRIIDENWSVKALIREIALSRTWQLASTYNEQNFAIDPDNEFLWRMNKRRLESEAIRDAVLAVSGQLDLERPLGTYLREVGEGGVGQNVFEPVIRAIDANTRSVYLPRVRSVLPEMLETFDAPDASLVTGSRDTTSSPLQSLYLMNNEFVQKQAVVLAERLHDLPRERQTTTAYELILGRIPTDTERELAADYLQRFSVGSATDKRQVGRLGQSSTTGRANSSGRGRGRFSQRSTDSPETPETDTDTSKSMSPLAIYCQALLSCMEFQTID
ncbi:PSD1 and planctomycete cytochrome C domain-containing protein [Aporhodopirellula aestuarii]|uniref:PSD1 and planctomycete cytochrome C domain-containing protein n=1 Tax=Aporhodopirellula aestuarii TaxID=2950107 RepID=A0ABT0U5N1_9BACT|nr:PSD1 and planctomycete cytochrome C domain-containing protein [Aporhodopirellula aestuarii]MCM2372107.1 PSD1 and planctomycete cytochrome C domain-containing protein [Aporhodopirellula aestuarii]